MRHTQPLLDCIGSALSETLGKSTRLQWLRDLPGGDINQAAMLSDGRINWFLKYHCNSPDGMFAAEARALAEISAQGCIRVPGPVVYGSDGDTAWLLLEFLELSSNGPASKLGEQLAALHAVTYKQHGWDQDNYIGSTLQLNTKCEDWSDFWRDYRIKPQLEMAQAAGHSGRLLNKGEQLLTCVDQLLDGHRPAASLLHGDLWAGNKAFTGDGQPVIFDPASYHGDRETDIAMTELFGGFDHSFYAAYEVHSPLPDGYRLRRDLYKLYHMLNHLNLFGGGYLSRCENIIESLLAQIR